MLSTKFALVVGAANLIFFFLNFINVLKDVKGHFPNILYTNDCELMSKWCIASNATILISIQNICGWNIFSLTEWERQYAEDASKIQVERKIMLDKVSVRAFCVLILLRPPSTLSVGYTYNWQYWHCLCSHLCICQCK